MLLCCVLFCFSQFSVYISSLPVILITLIMHPLSCRPAAGIWAQEVGDKLPEIDAVFATVDCAIPSFPLDDGCDVREEVSVITEEGHDCT